MPFTRKTRHWLRTYTSSKIRFIEDSDRIFEDKPQKEELDTYLKKNIRKTRSTDHRRKSSRSKHAEKSNHCEWTGRPAKPGRPQTNTSFSTPDSKRDGSNTETSYNHSPWSWSKVSFVYEHAYYYYCRFFYIFYVYISQGSVATLLRCGGIFTNYFIANCSVNVAVKELWKSVNIWQIYGQYTKWRFFETQCTNNQSQSVSWIGIHRTKTKQ